MNVVKNVYVAHCKLVSFCCKVECIMGVHWDWLAFGTVLETEVFGISTLPSFLSPRGCPFIKRVLFPFRESKELAEFTQMHPAPLSSGLTPGMMTSSLMTPNLVVTGGAALAGAGRWPPDPSTLTSHPWIPRSGAPPVWLSGSPYSM